MRIEIERESQSECVVRATFDNGAYASVHLLDYELRFSALRGETYYPPLVTVGDRDTLLASVPIEAGDSFSDPTI